MKNLFHFKNLLKKINLINTLIKLIFNNKERREVKKNIFPKFQIETCNYKKQQKEKLLLK